jgi:hypothetical protein
MPNMLTHYLCGKETSNNFADNLNYLMLNKYEKVYNIGTLGPDILFFHNQWPWKKDRELSQIADLIHSTDSNKFFKNMLKIISKSDNKKMLLTYFMGFTCHYALDCTCHPYIFYFSGFDSDGNLTHPYIDLHRDFETTIDFYISKEIEHRTPYDLNITQIFNISLIEQKIISEFLTEAINKTYNKNFEPEKIYDSINDFKKITSLLRDKNGFKKKIFNYLENVFNLKTKPSTMIYPIEVKDNFDYLNKNKSIWYNPWEEKNSKNDSFIELFKNGIEKSTKYFNLTMEYYNQNISLEDILKKLENLSYSTGLDCTKNVKFVNKKLYKEI